MTLGVSGVGSAAHADLLERYLRALLAGDRAAAVRAAVTDGVEKGLPVRDLYLGVVQPAQHRIGQLWQENRIGVADEHLATAITQLVLALVYPSLPRAPSNGKQVLLACVDDELHDLGARMAADFFEMAGFGVRYLGANLPTDSLLASVREDPPDLVALSATLAFHLDATRDAVRRLRETTSGGTRLALGGQAFAWAPGVAAQLGADVHGGSVEEAIAAAQRVLGVPAA